MITSTNGRLNLERVLPALMDNNVLGSVSTTYNDETHVLSDRKLRELEKNNIIRVLERSGWKVAGTQDAAAILGIPTSTLIQR